MYRFKMALKAALPFAISGIVCFCVGIVPCIIGFLGMNDIILIPGVVLTVAGVGLIITAYDVGKQRMNAICPECKKFVGNTDKPVKYSFQREGYEEKYDSKGKFIDYKFNYLCTITCPHCGNSYMFTYNISQKNAANADMRMNNFLKGILKEKDKTSKK